MTALWYVGPGRVELRPAPLPPRAADEALVVMRASALSPGTERLVLAGRVPESQYATMRAPLMQGDFPYPVKYGYAAVGVVEDGPGPLIGQRVFVLHPHQRRFLAPAAMCIPIPDAVPDARAVMAANMETAVNILWDAAPLPGERVLVIGAGIVGLLAVALLARIPGLTLTVIEPDPRRAAMAAALGAECCAPSAAPTGQELILHASGAPDGLVLALGAAGFEARIVEASWYGSRPVTLPLGEAFHQKRLRLISSQVGAVAPSMRGRRSHAERLALALALLADPRLDTLHGVVARFEELPDRLPELLAPGAEVPPCPVILYP